MTTLSSGLGRRPWSSDVYIEIPVVFFFFWGEGNRGTSPISRPLFEGLQHQELTGV